MEKLVAVSEDLKMADEMGERHPGRLDEVLRGYLLGKEYEAFLEKEAAKPEMDELERYQEERRIARGQKPKIVESPPKVDPDAITDMGAIKKYLGEFLDLYESYQKTQEIVGQYQEIKDLMMRAISLPAAESDLLMRYQTTLERRLSSAIGELLALQRVKKPELGT